MTLRQSDPKVKTTGRKSHDPFRPTEIEGWGVEKHRRTVRETQRRRVGVKG